MAALKHDLGKYVAWTSSNLEETAWTGPVGPGLVQALRGDLLQTRMHDQRPEAAWEVWERLTAGLERPLRIPELAAVEQAVSLLRQAESALRAGDAERLAALRLDIRAAQDGIRRELSALHRRLARE